MRKHIPCSMQTPSHRDRNLVMSVIHLPRKHLRVTERLRLATTKALSQKTQQTSCRQKTRLEHIYLHTLLEYTRQKRWRASYREFPVISKMKGILTLKKIKSKVPRYCFSRCATATVADGSDSHPWKWIFYLNWLFCLSSLSFLNVS